jgi:Tfp pilus assembly protein PilF
MSARALVALALGVVTFALYAPVMHFDFIRYDDPSYVVLHPLISQGLTWDNVRWALTAFEVGNWHPLTLVSHMADVSLLGMRAGAHHGVNALFHAGNVALLFLFFDGATRRRVPSFVVAALFAVHPLNVESVAWISQRKSVLCMFFLLLTLLAYVAWARRGGRARYAMAVLACAAALAAKPIAVVLPALLLLLDFWPLRRKSLLLLEKAPFAILAAAASFTAWAAQQAGGALGTLRDCPVAERLARTIFAYAWYLVRMVWPTDLSLFYPTTLGSGAALKVASSAILLAVVTVAVISFFGTKRYLAFGWAWYLVALFPVVGLVQFGTQIVADRYAYLALIGPFAALAFLGDELVASRSAGARRAAVAAVGAVLVSLAFGTGYALVPWRDSVSIFGRGYERAPDNVHALTNLGLELVERERFDEGIALLSRAAEAVPLYRTARVNLGYANAKAGRLASARAEYEAALALRPDDAMLVMELGRVLTQLQLFDEAEARFKEAVRRDPELANAWLFLGTILYTQGRFVEAEPALERAAALLPKDARALTAWGVNLAALERRDEALATLRAAVRLDPGFERARTELERIEGPGNPR